MIGSILVCLFVSDKGEHFIRQSFGYLLPAIPALVVGILIDHILFHLIIFETTIFGDRCNPYV